MSAATDLLEEDQVLIADAIRDLCSGFDDDYWAQLRPRARVPVGLLRPAGRGRLVRARDPRGVRRRRPRHHRGRGHAPRDRRERRGDERLLGDAPHRVRAQPGREVRQRPAQGDVPPPRRRRRPPRRVRRHRTRRRHRHRSHHHPRRPRRQRRMAHPRPQDLDHQGARIRGRAAHRAHRRHRQRPQGTQPVPRRPRSRLRRHPRRSPRSGATRSRRARSSTTVCPVESWRLVGEEDEGFRHLLHGLNPERVLLASEACGIGEVALDRADHLRQGTDRVRPSDRRQPGDQPPARARPRAARAPRG